MNRTSVGWIASWRQIPWIYPYPPPSAPYHPDGMLLTVIQDPPGGPTDRFASFNCGIAWIATIGWQKQREKKSHFGILNEDRKKQKLKLVRNEDIFQSCHVQSNCWILVTWWLPLENHALYYNTSSMLEGNIKEKH